MRAGSLPTSGSVSRNALISSFAQRGRYVRRCSSVPANFSGCGSADRLVRRQQGGERGVCLADHRQRPVVVELGEPEAAVLDVDLHAERAEVGQALHHPVGDLRGALDLPGVDLGAAERLQPGEERLAALDVVRSRPRDAGG